MSCLQTAYSSDVHSEHVIVHIVALHATNLQVEDLSERDTVLVAVDVYGARDEADDAVVHRWLVLRRSDGVLECRELGELLKN